VRALARTQTTYRVDAERHTNNDNDNDNDNGDDDDDDHHDDHHHDDDDVQELTYARVYMHPHAPSTSAQMKSIKMLGAQLPADDGLETLPTEDPKKIVVEEKR
jgi:hypothetical protein